MHLSVVQRVRLPIYKGLSGISHTILSIVVPTTYYDVCHKRKAEAFVASASSYQSIHILKKVS
jgi:hypothetical protein